MRDAIREDVLAQVGAFVEQLRTTFDPDAYDASTDGNAFDERLARLDGDFERMKRLFHDYLMAHWSDEIEHSLREKIDAKRSGSSAPGSGDQGESDGS